MKKLLVLVGLLAVLLGISAVVVVKFRLVPEGVLPFLDARMKEAPPPPPPPYNPIFVDMENLNIPIIINGALKGQVSLEIRLEVDNKERSKVDHQLARLQNAILKDLFDFLPEHMVAHPMPEMNTVKQRIRALCDKVSGKGVVRDVLFQSFYVR
ncbi:MAG: hypothetical protein ABT940_10845 [Alphaproteobacteria bacterium]